jgi:hypothetical protein
MNGLNPASEWKQLRPKIQEQLASNLLAYPDLSAKSITLLSYLCTLLIPSVFKEQPPWTLPRLIELAQNETYMKKKNGGELAYFSALEQVSI